MEQALSSKANLNEFLFISVRYLHCLMLLAIEVYQIEYFNANLNHSNHHQQQHTHSHISTYMTVRDSTLMFRGTIRTIETSPPLSVHLTFPFLIFDDIIHVYRRSS